MREVRPWILFYLCLCTIKIRTYVSRERHFPGPGCWTCRRHCREPGVYLMNEGEAAPLTRATRWYNLCAGKTQSSDVSRKPANATFRLRNWPEGTVWLNCSLTTAHLISANSLKRFKAFLLRKKHQNTHSYFPSKCRVKTIARKIWIFPRQFQNRSISQMSSPSMLYTAPLFSNIYPVLLWFGIKVYRVIKTLKFRHSNEQ